MSSLRISVLLTALMLCFCFATAVDAAPRVFVALHGNDANPCSSLSPCRTINHGLAVVDTLGEVVISESGDYDNVVIAKSITIVAAPGIYAGISAEKLDGIDIIRLSIADVVTLRNLTIKGTSTASGLNGISNDSAGNLFIDGCYISGVTTGILNSAPGKMTVHDSTVRSCQIGINVNSPVGVINNTLVDNSVAERNNIGIHAGSNARITVHNCSLFSNSGSGVRVTSEFSGIQAEANIEGSVFHSNNVGVVVGGNNGGTGVARLSKNTISKNLTGVEVGSGTVYSLQDNIIVSNNVDIVGALTPLSYN